MLAPLSGAAKFRPKLLANQIFTLLLLFTLSIWTLTVVVRAVEQLTLVNPEQKEAEEELGEKCKNIHKFTTISAMIELSETLNRVIDSRQTSGVPINDGEGEDKKDSPLARWPFSPKLWPKSPLFGSSGGSTKYSMMPCLNQADAINELRDVIKEKGNVCLKSHIDKIELYYNRHLKQRIMELKNTPQDSAATVSIDELSKKLITAKFFVLYSNQVSFHCKSRLLHWLNKIETDEQDTVRAFPWLIKNNKEMCGNVHKKFRKLSKKLNKASTEPENSSHQQVRMADLKAHKKLELKKIECELSYILLEISDIDDLVFVFDQLQQVQGLTASRPPIREKEVQTGCCNGRKKFAYKMMKSDFQANRIDTIVSKYEKEAITNMQVACSRLKPFYESTILSIVRLARLGFNPNYDNFDKVCKKHRVIRKWFGIAILCSTILSSNSIDSHRKEFEEKFETSENSVNLDAKIDSVKNEDGDRSFEQTDLARDFAPFEDELWVNNYSKDSIQRMRKSVLRMLKVETTDDRTKLRRFIENLFGIFFRFASLASFACI